MIPRLNHSLGEASARIVSANGKKYNYRVSVGVSEQEAPCIQVGFVCSSYLSTLFDSSTTWTKSRYRSNQMQPPSHSTASHFERTWERQSIDFFSHIPRSCVEQDHTFLTWSRRLSRLAICTQRGQFSNASIIVSSQCARTFGSKSLRTFGTGTSSARVDAALSSSKSSVATFS